MTRRPSRSLGRLGQLLAPVPTSIGRPVPLAGDEVPEVLAAADRHNLVPALWSALLTAQLVEPVPLSVLRFAHERSLGSGPPLFAAAAAHATNAARVDDLLDQSETVLAALADAGVRAAPLKGIDAVLTGRFDDRASRTMTDVDVLVGPAQASLASEVLAGLGYRPTGDDMSSGPAGHQLPAVVRPGRLGSVEVHTALAVERWGAMLDPDAVLDRARPRPVGAGLVLTRTDSATHLVLHAQLHDEAHLLLRLPLRALHETSLLLARGEPVDWDEVEARFSVLGRRGALRSHLDLTSRLFGVPSPRGGGPVTALRSRAVRELDELPRTRELVGQVAYLPRSLGADRMRDLYGAEGPRAVWTARIGHVGRSARTRTRRREGRARGLRGPSATKEPT